MRSCIVYKLVGSLRLDWRSVVAGSVSLRKNIQRIWQQERQGGCAQAGHLLRTGMLRPVYHRENGPRTLRELGRSYQTISKDLTRVMNRLKALYRGWGIPCAGTQVYAVRSREEWLSKLPQAGVRCRAELLYRIRTAKYTVDGGARAMREVFRSASWRPRLWA
jgi:hypothetical protein